MCDLTICSVVLGIALAVVMLLDPLRNRIRRAAASEAGTPAETPTETPNRLSGIAFSASFFGVGVYGGFVQAGVGFFILGFHGKPKIPFCSVYTTWTTIPKAMGIWDRIPNSWKDGISATILP